MLGQGADGVAQAVLFQEGVSVQSRAAGIGDVLDAFLDLVHVGRFGPHGAEQVDLEDQGILGDAGIQNVAERRVGDQPAIPVGFVVDHHHGETRRQRGRGHDVLGRDDMALILGVEIDEIAGAHLGGAETQTDLAAIDAVEIDVVEQGLAQRRGVVEADRLGRARLVEPGRQEPRPEHALDAVGGRPPAAQRAVIQFGHRTAQRHLLARKADGQGGPEGFQLLDAVLGRIAGDDRGIDGADGNPGDPVRPDIVFMQDFEGAGLIGAERPAALEHQDGLVIGKRLGAGSDGRRGTIVGHDGNSRLLYHVDIAPHHTAFK